jgi:phosphate:Na+ symporter
MLPKHYIFKKYLDNGLKCIFHIRENVFLQLKKFSVMNNFWGVLLIILSNLFSLQTSANNDREALTIDEVSIIPLSEGVEIFFDLNKTISENDEYYVVARYIPKSDFSSHDLKWKYTDFRSIKEEKISINELNSKEHYFISLGISKTAKLESTTYWTEIYPIDFQDAWIIGNGIWLRLLALLGALGLFIFGMKTMSEGMQKATGPILRKSIGGMISNNANGIFYGFITTGLVQSSSAITVMVVSFVNTGLLNLKQGISVIIGANIGTTVTAWLIALLGFQTFMPDYALIIFLIAIIFLFSGKIKLRSWGEVLTGIAFIFFGFEFLKGGIPDVRNSIEQFEFLNSISGTAPWNVLLATTIGIVITILFQSSIAALAITLLLTARGIIPYEMALGMVLGSNIGTTITANIAALVGNIHAKRAARAHLIFNLLGGVWLIFLFPYFLDFLNFILIDILQLQDPMISQQSRPVGLALFHSLFNIINSLVLFWFIDMIARAIIRYVPAKSDEDENFQFGYIKAGVLSTPEITILEAKKEIAKFGKITSKMSVFFQKLLIETDKKKKKYLYQKIEKYEDITDRVEIELINYLTKTSEDDLSDETSSRVRSMMATTNYLERIGDIFYQMSLNLKRKEESKIWFSPEQRQNLQRILRLVDEAFEIMVVNLAEPEEKINIKKALEKEHQINTFRDKLRKEHFENIEKQEYNIKSGIIYSDLFFSCEKVGDHIMSITEELVPEHLLEEAKEMFRNK